MRSPTKLLGLLLALATVAWAPTAAANHDPPVVGYPPSGSQIGIKGFDAKGYSQETKFPLTVDNCASWFIYLRVVKGFTGAYGGGQVSNFDIGERYNGLTMHAWRKDLPLTITVEGSGQCTKGGDSQYEIRFKTTVTLVDGPTVLAPGGTKKPGASKPAKTKSILTKKNKQTLATAAGRLRGYAENASALSKLCVLGALKKEALKQSLKVAAKDLAVSYVPLVGDIPTDPCSAAMSAFIGIISVEADWFDQLAKDPPDRRYRTIAQPKVRVPVSFTGNAQTVRVAAALNALTANLARVRAYQEAVLTSVERAQGASAARNAVWTKKQTAAARRFAAVAATALSATPGLVRQLSSALQAAGYGTAEMTAADAAAFQAEIKAGGLPKGLAATLTVFGAPPRLRAQLRAGLQAANPDELVGLGFPEILTDPGFGDAIRSGAAEFRRIARG